MSESNKLDCTYTIPPPDPQRTHISNNKEQELELLNIKWYHLHQLGLSGEASEWWALPRSL